MAQLPLLITPSLPGPTMFNVSLSGRISSTGASHGCFSLMESRPVVVSMCSALALGCDMEISLDMGAAIGRKVSLLWSGYRTE
jgi:hypothetical protein